MKTIIYLMLFLFLLGCNNSDDNNNPECNNIACTLEFRTITVHIIDDLANPVALDGIKVTSDIIFKYFVASIHR